MNLPEGGWVHFWTGKEYEGGAQHKIAAPLGKIPVFYRKESRFGQLFREVADKYTF